MAFALVKKTAGAAATPFFAAAKLLGKFAFLRYTFVVEKSVRRYRSFAEADQADRDFYRTLTGNERLQLLLELINHDPKQRLERVCRIIKLARN
jgi:hypothetical protein